MKKQEIINKLKSAKQTSSEMKALAEVMKEWAASDYDKMLDSLMQGYESQSIGNLLISGAINSIGFDPELLTKSIMYSPNDIPFGMASTHQTDAAIPYLLDYSYKWINAEPKFAMPAMQIAVELALKYNTYHDDVKKMLSFLIYRCKDTNFQGHFIQCQKSFNKEFNDNKINWVLKRDPLKELAKNYINVIEPEVMGNLKTPCDIGKLLPKEMSDSDLMTYSSFAGKLGLFDKAMQFLEEIKKRNLDGAEMPVMDCYNTAITYKDRNALNNLIHNYPDLLEDRGYCFPYHAIKNPDVLNRLEELLRGVLYDSDPNITGVICYCYDHFPSIGIFLYRAIVIDNLFDTEGVEVLMELIKHSRIRLDLDPDDDPLFKVVKTMNNLEYFEDFEAEISNLKSIIDEARSEIKSLKHQVKERSKTNKRLGKEVEEWKKKAIGDKEYQALKKERDELLYKVDQLKMDLKTCKSLITEAKDEKKALQDRIDEQELIPAIQEDIEEDDDGMDESGLDVNLRRLPKKFVYPTFEDSYYQSVEKLDVPTKSKAWDAANGFASSREDIWKHTEEFKGAPGYYRIKFHNGYRLIIQWKPEKTVRIIEVIHRNNLETWIKNH